MGFDSPKPPKLPPAPMPTPPPVEDLEAATAQRKLNERQRRGRDSLIVNPGSAAQSTPTGLRIG